MECIENELVCSLARASELILDVSLHPLCLALVAVLPFIVKFKLFTIDHKRAVKIYLALVGSGLVLYTGIKRPIEVLIFFSFLIAILISNEGERKEEK